ncbi:hypothetical protein [Vibrio sp. D431a]|uniref:hypothetical protein n=1 Tax=Vibrio sp. D431a TaxID=2837388 RepID=UPI0025555848|nr:hypothetical protein [Vibrio sp. D431a]MDK9789956.1 hypothetical protein [Vibrio sp. D431a]
MIDNYTLIEFDQHKLAILLASKVEDDRGFIKFFRKEIASALDDEKLLQEAAMHGNGIPVKLAKEVIAENNYVAPFKPLLPAEVDFTNLNLIDHRSFFNDMEGQYSGVFFKYKEVGSKGERLEYGYTVVDFNLNEDPKEALIHSLKTIGGLKVTPVVGELF